MTIRFLKSLQGNYEGQIVSGLSGVEETRLVGLGYASYDLDGEASNIIDAKFKTSANGDITGLDAGGETILLKNNKIRSIISAALNNNAQINAPLAPAPTWLTTTLYQGGQVVRGSSAGNTLNLYLMVGVTGNSGYLATGTTGATSPSGTGSALITDGTCIWQYIGRATATGTYPMYSTVAPTTSSDVMNGFVAFCNANNYTAMGLTNQYVLTNTALPVVNLTNVLKSDNVTAIPKNFGTEAFPSRPTSGIRACFRFVTNAKKWLAFGGAPLSQYTSNLMAVKVNGQWLWEAGQAAHLGSLINPGMYLIDLTSIQSENKIIEVFFKDAISGFANKVAVQAEEFVTPLSDTFKIAIEGDSIGDMSYLSSLNHKSRSEVILGELLGSTNVLNNCMGGTGLISDAYGVKTRAIQRMPDITAFNPDLLVLFGLGHNDDSYTSSARKAAMLLYLQTFRAANPASTICVMGCNVLAGESISGLQLTVEQDWVATLAIFNDKNTFFVPILTAPIPLVSSGTNGYFFQSTGASPYNDGHPTSWYYYNVMQILVNGIRKYYNAEF